MLGIVRGRHLRADTRLAFRYHGEGKADHVDAFLQEFVGHLRGQLCVAQHHRDDRVLTRQQVETELFHAGAETLRVVVELLAHRLAFFTLEHVENLQRGFGNDRRQRVREQVRTRAVAQPVNHFLLAGGVTAGSATQRLAQRAGDDVDATHCIAVLVRTLAVLAHEADAVAVVHHHECAVLVGQVADGFQVGDVAVHREHRVGGDHDVARTFVACFFQFRFQVRHVVVPVAETHRLAEADTIDDRGVVQLVGDDRILRAEQRLEQAAVRIKAGGIEDGVLHAQEIGNLLLEFLVHFLRAADEAYRSHAVTPFIEALLAGLDQVRVVGEAEVVVRTEIQHMLAGHIDISLLLRGDHAFLLVQATVLQLLDVLLQLLDQGGPRIRLGHGVSSGVGRAACRAGVICVRPAGRAGAKGRDYNRLRAPLGCTLLRRRRKKHGLYVEYLYRKW